jgi:hypothetical protein
MLTNAVLWQLAGCRARGWAVSAHCLEFSVKRGYVLAVPGHLTPFAVLVFAVRSDANVMVTGHYRLVSFGSDVD